MYVQSICGSHYSWLVLNFTRYPDYHYLAKGGIVYSKTKISKFWGHVVEYTMCSF
jgi:hypothetical protein